MKWKTHKTLQLSVFLFFIFWVSSLLVLDLFLNYPQFNFDLYLVGGILIIVIFKVLFEWQERLLKEEINILIYQMPFERKQR